MKSPFAPLPDLRPRGGPFRLRAFPSMSALELHSFPFFAMGSSCIVHLYAPSPVEAGSAALAAQGEIERIEARYSRYRPDSLLSEINRAAARGESIDLDEETLGLLSYARTCHERSGGLFDITSGILRRAWDFSSGHLPSQEEIEALLPFVGLEKIVWAPPRIAFPVFGIELDLGGIGKEYAADRAAEICTVLGIKHGLVDLGGDLRILGPHPDGAPWEIGIRDPFRPDERIASVRLSGGGLATSGDYERKIEIGGKRYGHLLDPRTGWPVEGLASVSVAADRCLVAGSLATMAMLRGREGAEWLAELPATESRHLWIDRQGQAGGTLGDVRTPLESKPKPGR